MTLEDPNIAMLDAAAHALEPLLDEFVLVGGCSIGLLVTDGARPPIRPTNDVDVVTIVPSRYAYYALAEQLRALGFQEVGHPICRFRKGVLCLDVMPTDPEILTFGSRWAALAVATSISTILPSGLKIRHASAPLIVATKLEAFENRGHGDFTHHDLEDIITLVDGRPEIIDEMAAAEDAVRDFVQGELDDLLANEQFTGTIPMHFHPDAVNQARVPVVIERLRRLAGI